MKPDDSYIQIQIQLRRFVKFGEFADTRGKLRNQLEKKFMAAWQFAPDRLRLGCKLRAAVSRLRTKSDEPVHGLDHCTYYSGADDQRIIVTQPYGITAAEVLEDLTLLDGTCPEVIDASEWGFHYPHEAKLFILKFPFGFQEAMQRHEKEVRRMEIEKHLEQTKSQTEYEPEEDYSYV